MESRVRVRAVLWGVGIGLVLGSCYGIRVRVRAMLWGVGLGLGPCCGE